MNEPATLDQVLAEVRRVNHRLDEREELTDLVRQSISSMARVEDSVRGLVKRIDDFETRMQSFERRLARVEAGGQG